MARILEDIVRQGLGVEPRVLASLTPWMLKFVPEKKSRVDTTYRVMLGEAGLNDIAPEAPNKDAVRCNYNVALSSARDTYEKGVAEITKLNRGGNWLEELGIKSFPDYVRLNIAFFENPVFLYFAGYKLLSAVGIGGELLVGQFESIVDYKNYANHFPGGMLLQPARIKRCATEAAADIFAARTLSLVYVRMLTLTGGTESNTLTMEVMRYFNHLVSVRLQAPGDHQEFQIAHDGVSDLLKEYTINGMRVKCCCTCAHFTFSGMSFDMSGGQSGYCSLRMDEVLSKHGQSGFNANQDKYGAIVMITDICADHKFI